MWKSVALVAGLGGMFGAILAVAGRKLAVHTDPRIEEINLKDSFIRIKNDEAYIENMHIAPYEQGNRFNHEPLRTRKLLLHKKEIKKLQKEVKESGLTIVPTKLYFNTAKLKVEIALVRGKKLYDKRQDLKEKDSKRDIERALKNAY